jgi:diguanylate cyclase (GGDEF)-like protein
MKRKIEKLLKRIKELEFLAYFDELTKVYNRRGFIRETEKIFKAIIYKRREIERRTGYKIPLSLIFLDIDNFKTINDSFGHKIGDLALEKVAKVLKENLRESDIIGRLGGEEFIIALIGCNLKSSWKIAENLREKIEKIVLTYKKEKIKITASFGVVNYKNEKTLLDLISKADKAMYQAKKEGKNRVFALDAED